MLFHRRQDAEGPLYPPSIVIVNIALDHLDQVSLAGKPPAIIAFPFQNAPEALHRAVVDTLANAGHTLGHPGLLELVVEGSAGVLEPSVAVKQRMGIGVGFHSLVKGFVDKRVVIVLAEDIGHDPPVVQVQDGAQIELVYRNSLIPLEFRHIGEPFLIGLVRVELAVQDVFRNILGILGPPGAALVFVLDGGFDILGPADAQHALVIDMDAIVVAKVVIEPPVPLIRALLMDLLNRVSQTFIFLSPAAQFPGDPFMVGRAGHMEQFTGRLNGIPLFLVALLYGNINLVLSYFRKASLLSTSSNFFSRSRSISARYNLCLSCSISICAFSSSVRGA